MSPRRSGRTETCGRTDATARFDEARAFLDVAELIGHQDDDLATPNVAASLAVLAGIAASDAACCIALGRRARGQDHRQALVLVRQIADVGEQMARDLERLLAVKDDAHYGILHVTGQRAAAALRWARRIVRSAEDLVEVS